MLKIVFKTFRNNKYGQNYVIFLQLTRWVNYLDVRMVITIFLFITNIYTRLLYIPPAFYDFEIR